MIAILVFLVFQFKMRFQNRQKLTLVIDVIHHHTKCKSGKHWLEGSKVGIF